MKQQRHKGIGIGELNRSNAQHLEKSESMEADNGQPNPFQESSMAPALTIGTATVKSFVRMNNEEESAQNKEFDASNPSSLPPQQR